MNNQNGAIAILTAVLLTAFLGFVALAVDTGYLFASKNELQNAADAGALAGARELYFEDGAGYGVNPDCNLVAYNTAIQNFVAKGDIEIKGEGTNNTQDIQRGHWSFATRKFTQSDNTTVKLWDEYNNIIPKDVLDADETFVNAVQVTARRETDPITLFFAKILGQSEAKMSATAVAYIGFAGTFYPSDFDAPVALCEEYLGTGPDDYECGVAVWYEAAETAMWTNFDQVEKKENLCNSANNSEIMKVLNGNLDTLYAGLDLGVMNGIASAHDDLKAIWESKSKVENDSTARKIVEMTLPVIKCIDENSGKEENNCAKLVGGVKVELLWMTDNTNLQEQGAYGEVPFKLYDLNGDEIFTSTKTSGKDRWEDFAKAFDLLDDNEDPIDLSKNQMYFRASCKTSMDPTGGPGGENFGLLSKIPVLVD